MSLTKQQQINTLNEFQENFDLLGLSAQEIANELRTSPEKVEAILLLQPATIEEPWILKNYLVEKLLAQGKTPVPFSALIGDYHDYWFLDARKIEKNTYKLILRNSLLAVFSLVCYITCGISLST